VEKKSKNENEIKKRDTGKTINYVSDK